MKKAIAIIGLVMVVGLGAYFLMRPAAMTPKMTTALMSYADNFDTWYPNAERSIARICLAGPSDLYINPRAGLKALVCPIPDMPGHYGVVTFEQDEVLDTFFIRAGSDAEVSRDLAKQGFHR